MRNAIRPVLTGFVIWLGPTLGLAGADEADAPNLGLGQAIGEAEWRDMVQGRTVTYRIGPDVWAYELYAPYGDKVWIQMADGTCMDGTWSYAAGTYCFNWLPELASCFQHVRSEGEILIVPVDQNGIAGAIQTVAAIGDLPLTCGPTVTS